MMATQWQVFFTHCTCITSLSMMFYCSCKLFHAWNNLFFNTYVLFRFDEPHVQLNHRSLSRLYFVHTLLSRLR